MKQFFCSFRRPFPLLFFSAVLSALPMTFPSLFLLSWVSFVPFFLCLGQTAGKGKWLSALCRGAFFGFVYHLFVYFWFWWLYPLEFTGMGSGAALGVVLLAWIGISFLHGALFAIPTLICHIVSKLVKSRSLLFFAGILGILSAQRIMGLSQLAFPWVRVSLGQYRAPALIQSAALFGMEGLDLLILSVSALLALAILNGQRKRIISVLLAFVLFGSNLLFGVLRLSHEEGEEAEITVASVQGCILSGDKWSSADAAFQTYTELTRLEIDEDVELVVWPESAVPTNLATDPELLAYYQKLSDEVDAPILMGCFWKQDGITTNSAVLLDSQEVSQPYTKRILVPFGERMPYRRLLSRLFPALTQINMLKSDLAPGEGSALMELNGNKVGSVICFDSIFPQVVRESVTDGAELLVLVTNDSWYEDSPAVWQHLAHAVFRSVENSRSIVRCANSGVTAYIDERGRVQSELGPLKQGVLTDSVSFCKEETLYSAVGDVSLPVGGAVLLLWLVILMRKEGRLCRKSKI